MQEVLKLNNLGDKGLNSDIPPFELPPGFISYGTNFRVRNGTIAPFNGSLSAIDSPGSANVGFLKHVRIKQGDYWVQASRTQVLIANNDIEGWSDISSKNYDIPDGGQFNWTGAQLGQILVMNNNYVFPEYWANDDVQTDLLLLPFSPTQTWEDRRLHCKSMRVHKNFLIAMNLATDINNPGDPLEQEFKPNGYRISHPAEQNAIPFTWDTTDRGSIAIEAQLGGDGGEIVDGRTLRNAFVIYSKDSIDVLSFDPSSEFYWNRQSISSTVGLLSQNCLTEVKGAHYLIVDSDIVVNSGEEIQSIMYKRIQRRFNSRVNDYTALNSFVARNDAAKEIWFCVPEDNSETASIAYVFNWNDATWSLRDLPSGTADISYGSNPGIEALIRRGQWRGVLGSWTSQSRTWGSQQLTALDDILGSVNVDGEMFEIDPKNDILETEFSTVIERTDIPVMDHSGNISVVRMFPTAEGAPFMVQLGTQQQAKGPVTWSKVNEFDPGVDRYVDFRLSGELLSYRITSIGKNRFRFSGMEIIYVPSGLR